MKMKVNELDNFLEKLNQLIDEKIKKLEYKNDDYYSAQEFEAQKELKEAAIDFFELK